MNRAIKGTLLVATAFVAFAVAYAEVQSVAIKFRGGCTGDTRSTCAIQVLAEGSDLKGLPVGILRAETVNGPFKSVSVRPAKGKLNRSGKVVVQFRNLPGCYVGTVLTEAGLVQSPVLCQKSRPGRGASSSSSNSSSSSSSGFSSSAGSNSSGTSSSSDDSLDDSSSSGSSSSSSSSNSSDNRGGGRK